MGTPWEPDVQFRFLCNALSIGLEHDAEYRADRVRRLTKLSDLLRSIPSELLDADLNGWVHLELDPFLDPRLRNGLKYFRNGNDDGFEYNLNLLYGVRPAEHFVDALLTLDPQQLLEHLVLRTQRDPEPGGSSDPNPEG